MVKFLNSNQIKILACVFMLIDHIGAYIFTDIAILRIIGRLAFPLFAFFIAQGCYYTKHKKKYLGQMCLIGGIIMLIEYFVGGSFWGNVLVTFSFSIAVIFCLQEVIKACQSHNVKKIILFIVIALAILCGAQYLNSIIEIDYGVMGILFPVIMYIPTHFLQNSKYKTFYYAWFMAMAGLILAFVTLKQFQIFCVLSALVVLFYNGERGKLKLKYFFYIFYPVHRWILSLIVFLLGMN